MKKLVSFSLSADENSQSFGFAWLDDETLTSAQRALCLDAVIAYLDAMRREHPVPVQLVLQPTDPRPNVVSNPHWEMHKDALGQVVLSVRHLGFGWLHFHMPPRSLASLSEAVAQLLGGGGGAADEGMMH